MFSYLKARFFGMKTYYLLVFFIIFGATDQKYLLDGMKKRLYNLFADALEAKVEFVS